MARGAAHSVQRVTRILAADGLIAELERHVSRRHGLITTRQTRAGPPGDLAELIEDINHTASGAVLPDAKYRDRPGRLPDEKTPLGNPATRGVVQDMAARDQRRRSDQRQQRERPAAREARRRSRLSFAGLSSAAAKDVLSRSLGREVDVSQTGFDRAGRVGRVTRLLDDFNALVDRPKGGNAIAASTLPIRTRDALGRLLPVDLTLRRGIGTWQPENPLVPTTLPGSLDNGFKLGKADALRAQAGLPPLPAAERQRHMYGWWPMRDSERIARFKVLDYLKNETRSCDPSG